MYSDPLLKGGHTIQFKNTEVELEKSEFNFTELICPIIIIQLFAFMNAGDL